MHNIEWQYYAHLAKMESNYIKKAYFKLESKKLRFFEKKIKDVDGILAISKMDNEYLKKQFLKIPIHYISAFHPNEKVEIKEGRGDYILFHGDLSVKDNEQAVIFLLRKIMQGVDYQLVVSGLNPSGKLKSLITKTNNAILKANVSNIEMESLMKNAHVNILLSFQSAGMKLKLLNALFKGRFCVVNDFMIKNTGLENLCWIGETAQDFQNILNEIFQKEFSENEILKRRERLEIDFSNQKLAIEIERIIFKTHSLKRS